MSDQTTIALLGLAGVALGASVTLYLGRRKGSDERSASITTQATDLSKYVREQVRIEVDLQTKALRRDLVQVQKVLDSLYSKYTLVIGAFRTFYLATHRRLGADTPPLDARIRAILDEADEDTQTAAVMDEIRASIQREDDHTDQD